MEKVETWKHWPMFSSLDALYLQNFNVDGFFWKKSFDGVFSFYKECYCFYNQLPSFVFNQLWPKNSKIAEN